MSDGAKGATRSRNARARSNLLLPGARARRIVIYCCVEFARARIVICSIIN